MGNYPLRRLESGEIIIDPDDDCDRVVDMMLEINYDKEFCFAINFDTDFIAGLMEAGFLVMSMELKDMPGEKEPFFLLLPKLHLTRSVLMFPELRIKKSIRRFLSRYELRVNSDFEIILDKCIAIHGDAWLTRPLAEAIKNLHGKNSQVKPVSFGLYRDGELKAGEIGISVGRVYTSYSGYYEEDNAGTVQMILMTQWLEKTGFDFLDLGMPLDYKFAIGAKNIDPASFVGLFRKARY